MIYTYLLCDDGGVSNSENEILLPLKAVNLIIEQLFAYNDLDNLILIIYQ